MQPKKQFFARIQKISGGYAEGVTPVPIPNTEVKSLRADDTARVAAWESRSPPELIKRPARSYLRGAFAFQNNYLLFRLTTFQLGEDDLWGYTLPILYSCI